MKRLLLSLLVLSPTILFSQCFISFLSVNIGGCDPTDNLFDINGELQFTNPPASGQLIVEDCNGNQAVYNAPFTSPLMYTIPDIPSDGTTNCSVNAYFTVDPSCSLATQPYNNPSNCQCNTSIGTFTTTTTGATNLLDPYYLCFGDYIDITADGNFISTDFSSQMPTITYDPGLWLLNFDCAPYVDPPNDITTDSCLVGIASTTNGVWNIINNVGDGSTTWFRPITMYSMVDGQYAVSLNGGPWCYDAGPSYQVTYLEEIVSSEILDIGAGTITVTVSGGMPAHNGSSFTISNVVPATAVLSQSTVMNDSTFVISNLQSGQLYQYTITDSAGCSIVVGNPDPFVNTDELSMQAISVYPNPTTGLLNVRAPFTGEFTVRDLAGRLIVEGRLNQPLDLRGNGSGIYLIHCNNKVYKIELMD